MNDASIDRLVAEATTLTDERLEALDLDAALDELMREVGAAGSPAPSLFQLPRLRVALALAGAAFAIVVAVLLLGAGGEGDGGGSSSAYAAEAVAVAEANRRLLLDEPGWEIDYARFDSPAYGEVGYSDPRGRRDLLDMRWYPPEQLQQRTRPLREGERVTVGGEKGVGYPVGSGRYNAWLPVREGSFLLIDAYAPSWRVFEERLSHLEAVDVPTWLAAMPRSVVQPRDQDAIVADLLEGMPVPERFDPAGVAMADLPQDRDQLRAHVLYGAYCAWLDEWWFAQAEGDEAAATAAVQQLLAADRWPAVAAQAERGSLDEDFRMYARTVAAGDGDKAVYDQMMNCVEY